MDNKETSLRVYVASADEVYDFKQPAPCESGFAFSSIDREWQSWSHEAFRASLEPPLARHGSKRDFAAMERAGAFVLVLPCGRTAHLEAGWAVGKEKLLCILLDGVSEPDFMYKIVDELLDSIEDVKNWLDSLQSEHAQ